MIQTYSKNKQYSTENSTIGSRTKSLVTLASKLHKIAISSRLAVLVTNQMTTNVTQTQNNQHVPALGESWAHTTSTRIILSKEDDGRKCSLVKSLHTKPGQAYFRIVDDGIRDV